MPIVAVRQAGVGLPIPIFHKIKWTAKIAAVSSGPGIRSLALAAATASGRIPAQDTISSFALLSVLLLYASIPAITSGKGTGIGAGTVAGLWAIIGGCGAVIFVIFRAGGRVGGHTAGTVAILVSGIRISSPTLGIGVLDASVATIGINLHV